MDSITQGVLGAAAAQSIMQRRLPRGAGWIGAIGGMAADLDVFIRSSVDPTVSWVFHRNFTHSLIFIPLGGLLAAIPFLLMKRYKGYHWQVILASIIGYATHAPLDMLTSYGTQMFWPFSNHRVAFDWIAIVDPVYTIPLAIGVYLTARSKNPRPVRIAFLLTTLYLCFGGWQHARAARIQHQLAEIRGVQVEHSRVMPMPGWLVYWRSVYKADGKLYIDGVRTPWFGTPRVLTGGVAQYMSAGALPPPAAGNPETQRRVRILDWFADGLTAEVHDDRNIIGDMRFTVTAESLTPLWGLQLDAPAGDATAWRPQGDVRDIRILLRGLIFDDPRYLPLITPTNR
jgi:inner membrane protein